MDIASMLKPSNIRCEVAAGSKKGALDVLSEMLAGPTGAPTPAEVLEGLASREKLGSTALGGALAMPHARLSGVDRSAAAFVKLAEPVDFDAPNGESVDLLFGLLLPDGAGVDEEGELGELARRLAEPDLQARLRTSDDPAVLCRLLIERLGARPAAASVGGL